MREPRTAPSSPSNPATLPQGVISRLRGGQVHDRSDRIAVVHASIRPAGGGRAGDRFGVRGAGLGHGCPGADRHGTALPGRRGGNARLQRPFVRFRSRLGLSRDRSIMADRSRAGFSDGYRPRGRRRRTVPSRSSPCRSPGRTASGCSRRPTMPTAERAACARSTHRGPMSSCRSWRSTSSSAASVEADIPPGEVREFRAAAPTRTGVLLVPSGWKTAWGTAKGKWRLDLDSPTPITVVNLLASPTGHLTDLSAARAP